MSSSEKTVNISAAASFNAVVDETCERLMEKQKQYSIRRIHEMEVRLAALEQELDEFLFAKDEK